MKVWTLVGVSVLVLSASACQKKPAPVVQTEMPPQEPLGQMSTLPPPEADPYASDTMAPPRASTRTEPSAAREPADTGRAGRTYITKEGDTFIKLARKFYNNQGRWKEIWEANKARVPDPDKLPVGVKLIIP